MKKAAMIIAGMLAFTGLDAQNETDALRYSFLTFGGTARYMATGGAFGALGADISTLATNPAGIGLYRASEFTFSPDIYVGKTTSSFNGPGFDDSRTNFNIGNVGMVFTVPGSGRNGKGWQFFQFGFGLLRNQNFNTRSYVSGYNYESSIMDVWRQYADGNRPGELNNFDTRLAFDAWLLDTIPGGNGKTYYDASPHGGVWQSQTIYSDGYMNEWDFSFGGNYGDKLYFGMTIGLPWLRYNEEKYYREEALTDSLLFKEFESMEVNEFLYTKGNGINFKFGLIYQPVNFVRIGASVHTPTSFFDMEDSYSTVVRSKFDNGDNYTEYSPAGYFEYELNTPFRFTGSVGFIILKQGFISAEYEFVDYRQAELQSDWPEDFREANYEIDNIYTNTGNLRVGAEWKIDQFSLRGGYALYGNPYKEGVNTGERTSYTAGIGYREGPFFIDFGFVLTKGEEEYYFYDPSMATLAPVKREISNQNYVTTLGFKF